MFLKIPSHLSQLQYDHFDIAGGSQENEPAFDFVVGCNVIF
jgi:hypothetical protein